MQVDLLLAQSQIEKKARSAVRRASAGLHAELVRCTCNSLCLLPSGSPLVTVTIRNIVALWDVRVSQLEVDSHLAPVAPWSSMQYYRRSVPGFAGHSPADGFVSCSSLSPKVTAVCEFVMHGFRSR